MSRSISVCSLALATICASTVLASAQVTSSSTESTSTPATSAPVAYVYVSSATSITAGHIHGYAAAADGSLKGIAGSPVPTTGLFYMAVNGAWLFGATNQFTDIDSYSIGANGALTLRDTYNVTPPGPGVISVYLDHTGSTLYADLYTTNNDYLSFSIDQSTGQLSEIGDLPGGPSNGSPVSFIGNNIYGYSGSCYHFGAEIIGVQRHTNGTLSYLNNFNPPYPAEKSGGFYCPTWKSAPDPTNHVAIAMEPLTSNWAQDGPWQLAVYTADQTGNLTTTSTYSNMPAVAVGLVSDYWASSDGKYLAVGGTGLQIFHFNGANPITKFTGRIGSDTIDQIFWDNVGHVYAISKKAGKLFVYTVTAKGVTQAPGSPHSIGNIQNLIVLPK